MKKITRWFKAVKNNKGEITGYEFNHIEDGWSDVDTPADKFKLGFAKTLWTRDYAFLDDSNKVIDYDEAYQLSIPACCPEQTYMAHSLKYGLCWELQLSMETGKKPDCAKCNLLGD